MVKRVGSHKIQGTKLGEMLQFDGGYLLPLLEWCRLFDLKDFVFDQSHCPISPLLLRT